MYVIVNPRTLAQHGCVFKARSQAVAVYRAALETYGITKDYVVYRLEKN